MLNNMFNIHRLWNWLHVWPFENKNNFVFWQFLRCMVYSHLINLSTYFLTYYHCGYKLLGAEKTCLLIYNTLILLWMVRRTYIGTLKFKGNYPIVKNWNSINKLWYRLYDWQFKNIYYFILGQLLGCILYVYCLLGLPLLFSIFYHCRTLLTGSEELYLTVYNLLITLSMLYGTYKNTLKYKKL